MEFFARFDFHNKKISANVICQIKFCLWLPLALFGYKNVIATTMREHPLFLCFRSPSSHLFFVVVVVVGKAKKNEI